MKIILVTWALLISTTLAFAQVVAPIDTRVPLSPFYELFVSYVAPVLATLIALFIGWLAELLRKKFGLDIEAKHREALQTALTNGASLIINKGGSYVAGKEVDVKNPIFAVGIKYVQEGARDAMKYFGLGPEDVALKLAAKLPQVTTPQQTVSSGQTAILSEVAEVGMSKKAE